MARRARDLTRRPTAAGFLRLALVFLALPTAACAPYQFRGAAFDPPIAAPDFTLTDDHGEAFRLASLQGGPVLLMFGYTSCADVCPATLAVVRQALDSMSESAARVRLLFVTVDPLRDTPPVLNAYLAQFSPQFVGLTGNPLDVAVVMQDYGIDVQTASPAFPASINSLDHTGRLYLIDGEGRLRAQYPVGASRQDIRLDLEHVLRPE